MNIYEDEKLEKKFNELTDQLGHLFLDMLLISLKKVNHENILFKDFEDARNFPDSENFPF